MFKWEKFNIQGVAPEHILDVIQALADKLGITLERKDWYDAGPDYRFVDKN